MKIEIREVTEKEKLLVLDLIATDYLRPEGILEKGTKYWGAFSNGDLIGVMGCEYQNQFGLLRSALVAKPYRKNGIGERLTQTLLKDAKKNNIEAIYLFSTDAGPYWMKQGFKQTTVAELVDKLGDTPQVKLFERLGWLPTEDAYKLCLRDLNLT